MNTHNPNQTDADNDSFGDACDNCPSDPNKTSPEVCGCWVPDNDSDNDGILNCVEDINQNSIVDDGETDPNNMDTDGDEIQDGTELGYTVFEIGTETDTDIFIADLDPSTQTDPLLVDTDGDLIWDGHEDDNQNGIVDLGESDPVDPYDPCSSRDYFVIDPMLSVTSSSDTNRVVFFDDSQTACYGMVSCEKQNRDCITTWNFGGDGNIVGGNGDDIIVFEYDAYGDYDFIYSVGIEGSGTSTAMGSMITAEEVETPLPDLNIGSSIDNSTVSLSITDPEPSDAAIETIIVFWGDRYRTEHPWPPSAPIKHTYTRTGSDYHIRLKTLNEGAKQFNYTFMYDEDLKISIP
ncbi:MAG: hypothetical protein H8E41_13655 [Desulfobulbaceae bacterium]|uniref:Uncharacterized protein n=1 Tax=Candidatus Desulfobia pelagia TaxID=2841692 RepID=A0A8J6NFK8_9BACT|nr:hypothetical protein [Candidatus Desulfobia pelagia]